MQIYNDELYHWGVKGMKWGVRRYQKRDGTLTTEGRKRYGRLEKVASEIQNIGKPMDQDGWTAKPKSNSTPWYGNQQKTAERLQKYTKSARNRKAKNMSDEELNQRIARLQKEKQYQDLKKATSPGKAYVTDLLKTAGSKVVGGAAGAIGGMAGKVAVDAVMNHYGDIAVAAVNATGSDFVKKAAVTAAIASNVHKA